MGYESRMVCIYTVKRIPTLKRHTQIQNWIGNIMTSGDSLDLPYTKIKITTKKWNKNYSMYVSQIEQKYIKMIQK